MLEYSILTLRGHTYFDDKVNQEIEYTKWVKQNWESLRGRKGNSCSELELVW